MAVYESNMYDGMLQEALQVAHQAMEKYKDDGKIACYIKEVFEGRHGGTWQCYIGDRAYSVDHSYICFSAGGKKISLYRISY